MNLRIVLPVVIACLLSLSFCKKEPAPIVFTVTNKLTGEPCSNATIKWYNVAPPLSLMTQIGITDNKGQLTWNQEFDSLPDPKRLAGSSNHGKGNYQFCPYLPGTTKSNSSAWPLLGTLLDSK